MLPGPPPSAGRPLPGSLPAGQEHPRPPTRTVWCEEGRGGHRRRGLLERAPSPPCLLWQMHRRRNPAPQGLRASSRWLSTPGRLRREMWRALGGAGAGAAVWSAGRQHKAQISFPDTVSAWGLGSRWAPAQASYFLPVRWMCWNRVMEKAMPRICMIRMHIPTVPRTCLLSSNHIFTFS